MLALLEILEDRRAAVEPERLSGDLLAAAIGIRDKSMETVLAHMMAYAAACNRHQDDEAALLLETSLRYSAYASPSIREALIASAGIFQAERRKRIDLADRWLADLPETLTVPYRRLMVEGAILEAKADFLGALQKVDEIEKTISAKTKPARQQIALAPFAKWRSELEQKVTTAAPSSLPAQ